MKYPLSLTGTKLTFEDGTVIHMSLKDGLKLLCSLSREGGWELVDKPKEKPRDGNLS